MFTIVRYFSNDSSLCVSLQIYFCHFSCIIDIFQSCVFFYLKMSAGSNRYMDQVNDFLYLGSLEALFHLPKSFTHVISVLSDQSSLSRFRIVQKHLFIEARDEPDEDLMSHFGRCYDFITGATANYTEPKILVHCRAGRSRSATIVMMYLIRTHRYNFSTAYRCLKSRRPIVSINSGKNTSEKTFH